ncbi:MAG: endonuclease MutS2, partial [Eubacteriaceae bacterium]|nr:endonuclease MutS2 [Eubacteriaceae bacterium]
MNERSLKVLEYFKLLNQLESYCHTDGGKAKALALRPETGKAVIAHITDQTEEALQMTLRCGHIPIGHFTPIDDDVARAKIGSVLSMKALLAIASMLAIAEDVVAYYDEDTERATLKATASVFEAVDPLSHLKDEIRKKILSEDEMADNASRELYRIRKEIISKNARISERLNRIVTSPSYEKILQERIVTMRGNRYVVPVKQEYRNRLPGMVLDKSATGQTVFIEPMSVVSLNNELKELAIEEEKEIGRILKTLTGKIAQYALALTATEDMLVELDFIFAKASLALDMNANRVAVGGEESICFYKAVHPLLDPKTAVASDIIMAKDIDTIVITGPNTGGKTVTLKTIGLLSAMVQAGLFAPVAEHSSMRIFNNIFADIGDEQSIEQSLSTFSAHMKNIVDIVAEAGPDDLVLFDELGAGTDPTEGAALAAAILDTLHARQVTSVATTHYSELKAYALVTEGVVNASVEFDVTTLRPTYKLNIGVPGRSNAFEIAARLGLKDDIIKEARGMIHHDAVQFEDTLSEIEEARSEYEKRAEQIRKREAEIEEIRREAEKERAKTEAECRRMIEEAGRKADEMIRETRDKTEAIYKEIRAIQESTTAGVTDNKVLEELRKDIRHQADVVDEGYSDAKERFTTAGEQAEMTVGMKVRVNNLGQKGEILSISEKDKQA